MSTGAWRSALASAVAFACLAAPLAAEAHRRPTAAEKRVLKREALRACNTGDAPGECRVRAVRVSTVNPRYAWVYVVGEGYSGALMKRPTRSSLRFKVHASRGGGVPLCSEWKTPRAVLRDLRLGGLRADGSYGRC
jgi:hypothetical protein